MMSYATTDWLLEFDETELDDFMRPYLGNGYLGTGFDRLLITPWNEPPVNTLAAGLYDDGVQLPLPGWSRLDLTIGGKLWSWEQGHHQLRLSLDLRTGEAAVTDRWIYAPGREAAIKLVMLVPRGFGKASLLRLNVDAVEPVTARFGLDGESAENRLDMTFSLQDQVLRGDYLTAAERKPIIQQLRWQQNGATAEPEFNSTRTRAAITLTASAGRLELELRHRITAGDDDGNDILSASREEIETTNRNAWSDIWNRALLPDLPPRTRRMVLLFQFYLLGSLNTEGMVLGPLGLSAIGWGGMHFWDIDFWLFRPVLALWPEYARSMLLYRSRYLPQAAEYASRQKLCGALFGFKTDDRGLVNSKSEYESEIHVNIWIALAAVEYFKHTDDYNFLLDHGWPLLDNIARGLLSWGRFEDDGRFHLRGVIGPDEAMIEMHHHRCDDNFLTNYGTAKVFAAAVAIAQRLNKEVPEELSRAAERMYLPKPDRDGIYPEYEGYNGEGIKQADFILSLYPLGLEPGAKSALANLDYYHQRIMNYGPLMTTGIEACIMIKYGLRQQALDHLLHEMQAFCSGPFLVVRETRDNRNAVFLTGIGAFLQVMLAYRDPEFVRRVYDF